MTAFLPACTRCHCSAEAHTTVLEGSRTFEGGCVSEMFELGPCKVCDCDNYTFTVENPRTCYKVEGFR